jgi:hypothetical protein
MRSSFVHTALRRAFLLSLAAPAAHSIGCGGNVVVDATSHTTSATTGTGGSAGTSSSGTGGSTPSGCELASQTPVSMNQCDESFELVGPASACSPGAYGLLTQAQCTSLCPMYMTLNAAECWATDLDGGTTQLACAYIQPCGTGRRPPGLAHDAASSDAGEREEPTAAGLVARFLSDVAYLEAASVPAFEQLARELDAHGAPARLVRAARTAAREEIAHARAMARHAARAGGPARRVHVAPTPVRSLEAIAVDNAVEGCVRETFGAVLAMRQAERARSVHLRRSMKKIAREEASHAELAWHVARWVSKKLDPAAAERVAEARREAVETLARDLQREPHGSLVHELGLPTATEARAALDALRESLWMAPARA